MPSRDECTGCGATEVERHLAVGPALLSLCPRCRHELHRLTAPRAPRSSDSERWLRRAVEVAIEKMGARAVTPGPPWRDDRRGPED